jgi:gliding motility-associated-like protein
LGIDNFSFCGQGVDLVTGVNVETIKTPCETGFGQITLLPPNNSSNTYSYSLDGINFQVDNVFTGLLPGEYNITVLDDEGCSAEVKVNLEIGDPINVISSEIVSTICGEENGSIKLEANYPNVLFSIDNLAFNDTGEFDNLPAGDYTITVIDENDCIEYFNYFIEDSPEIILENIDAELNCVEGTYDIVINALGGNILMYSLDNGTYSDSPFFENVSIGNHFISILDEFGCEKSFDFFYDAPPPIVIPDILKDFIYCNNPFATAELSNASAEYLYSIDNKPFGSSTTFDNLVAGQHFINIKDQNGCIATLVFEIESFEAPLIIDANIVPTKCNEDNGAVVITTNVSFAGIYTLGGNTYQESNTFSNLPAGDYFINIVDTLGCEDQKQLNIPASTPFNLDNHLVALTGCQEFENEFEVEMGMPFSPFSIIVNGQEYQNAEDVPGLAFGDHIVRYVDEFGCEIEKEIFVDTPREIFISEVSTLIPECGLSNGQISFITNGGNGNLTILLNNEEVEYSPINNIQSGEYTLTVRDELSCENRFEVIVPQAKCEVVIPNVFSPNGDGSNDYFTIYSIVDYDVSILNFQIFDRWGSLVYNHEGSTSILQNSVFWDGKFNGKAVVDGVYVYKVDIMHPNGDFEVLHGDVTVIK